MVQQTFEAKDQVTLAVACYCFRVNIASVNKTQ